MIPPLSIPYNSKENNIKKPQMKKQVIKPSSPTPPHLKTYNLSFSDHFSPHVYIPLVFFYPYNGTSITSHQQNTSQLLKSSLSQTLTQYYPFAGRLVIATDGSYVDCNDEGVEFVEAQVNSQLSEAVDPHNVAYLSLDHFFQPGTICGPPHTIVMNVQLNYFDCGGLALAVSLSHKIGDTCTLYAFIKHWVAVSYNHSRPNGEQVQVHPPRLISSQKSICSDQIMFYNGKNCVSKSFIFPKSKIEQLKAKVGKMNPTRVEVVNSLLYGCAVRATMANKGNIIKVFILVQTANVRTRLANPLELTTVGNFSLGMSAITTSESELGLDSLIGQLKKVKSKLKDMTISEMNLSLKQALDGIKNLPSEYYYKSFVCTSLCGYPVYEVDFGWGNPVRVAFPGLEKFFVLMDTPSGDGIEALVTLEEEEMAMFQVDENLLEYACAV